MARSKLDPAHRANEGIDLRPCGRVEAVANKPLALYLGVMLISLRLRAHADTYLKLVPDPTTPSPILQSDLSDSSRRANAWKLTSAGSGMN